jgi:hypothetical protein
MTLIINVPGLLLDFSSSYLRVKYEKLEEYILTGNMETQIPSELSNNFESMKFKLLDDAYSIEELSYRSRIFIFSYLDKYYIEKQLIQFNLDSFITNVISLKMLNSNSPKELINGISRVVQNKNWILLTNSGIQSSVFKENGIKSILISNENGSNFKTLSQFIDFTSSHKIDDTLYMSKGCR